MTFDKEFKEAISRLTSAEKDKLIFRLLKKDLNLAKKLQFELLSGDSKLEDRRKQAKEQIQSLVNFSREHGRFASPGMLMLDMRNTSGIIKEHVKTTKDKYGEIYLHIFVLKEYLKIYTDYFKDSPKESTYTLNSYCIAKVFKIMILLRKMPKDLLFDFKDDIEEAVRLFSNNQNLMRLAIFNGLDIHWLTRNEIPDNIAEIEDEICRRGYLM